LERNPTIHAERYAHNKDRMQIAALQWRKDNPDKARDINSRSAHRRRAERNNSDEHYTLTQLRALREKSGGRCAYCDTKGRMTIDHIVSLRQGGSNSIRNIQFLCKPCNSAKQDKNPIVFAQEKGLLL
jgi:5-methylcytosine-specific restriction endonuclease McrA